ncbi:MAG: ParB/RepB/Spo0J family partition protein [Deltaproteobacteria bacterium]|nr:ParB/RepB/Spo0J family partition protein [Deltaproteobacteria bacterium]
MDMNQIKDQGPRKALGRGLAALIPTAATVANQAGLRNLPIEKIRPNRKQPRKHFDAVALEELAISMEERGVLQPIVVRRQGDDYEIVAGERRWRAAQKAGLHELPAIVKELTDGDALQVALIENLQRQDLDPLEEAEAFSRLLKDHGMSQDQLAVAIGKNRATIANSLRLLKLPDAVLKLLAEGKLTAGHARAVMTLGSDDAMANLAAAIVERGLSVREAERQARVLGKTPKTKSEPKKTPAEVAVEEKLQRAFGTKVRLHHRKGQGRVEIFFHSFEQLNEIIEKVVR